MEMKRFLSAGVLAVALAGCATVTEERRYPTGFSGRLYNSVSSQYSARPTEARVLKLSDGGEALSVDVTLWAPGQYGQTSVGVSYLRGNGTAYAAMFAKFLEWDALATERGDVFTKVMGRAPTGNGELEFTFHSGAKGSNYLSVGFCVVGPCISHTYYDPVAVRGLRDLVAKFEAGQMPAAQPQGVYK
jgi:hypothetical protein